MAYEIDWSVSALVLVDPQIDVLSEGGALWDLVGEHVTRGRIVERLRRLRDGAEEAGAPVFYASVRFDDHDPVGHARNPLDAILAERKAMRAGAGGRFLPELAPSEGSVVLTPRKGPSAVHSDFSVQMRRHGRTTAVFAGLIANLCVESHVRDAAEDGFDTVVVTDALGALSEESLRGALANFGLLASGLVTTDEAIESMRAQASGV